MLEFYWLLIVATLFLLNWLFIILSSVRVWGPLFALMVLFNLLFLYCDSCTLIFSSLKLGNGLKIHVDGKEKKKKNVSEIKYVFVKLVVIFTSHKIFFLICIILLEDKIWRIQEIEEFSRILLLTDPPDFQKVYLLGKKC